MSVIAVLAIVYIIAIVGIVVMKKIQPEDKIYPVWAVFVCIVLTCFVVWHVSQGPVHLIENWQYPISWPSRRIDCYQFFLKAIREVD